MQKYLNGEYTKFRPSFVFGHETITVVILGPVLSKACSLNDG